MGNSEVNDMYPETGITESTRKMFEFIDDMFTPNQLKQKRASHLYLQLAITELSQLII